MSQEDILNVLQKNLNKELTSTEIASFVDCQQSSIRRAMRDLFNDSFQPVQKRELTFEEKKQKYGKVINPRIVVYWIPSTKRIK